MLERREVVHREAGDDREQQPAAPEPLVEQVLRVARGRARPRSRAPGAPIWAWRASSVWMLLTIFSNIRSPTPCASADSPTNCRLVKPVSNTKLVAIANSIAFGGEQQLVDQVARRRSRPSCSCGRSLCVQSNCGSQRTSSCISSERDLRVAQLVERAEQRRRAPGAVAAEARGAQVADDRRELGQRQRRGVQLQRRSSQPGGSRWKSSTRPTASRTACDRRVLGVLAGDVLGVAGAERLVPARPLGVRQPRAAALHLRETRPPRAT